MRRFRADLHVHTALSPCAADEMTPPAIVAAAMQAGLEMIAICDHNSAGNVPAVQAAGTGALDVIAGIEITTAEEAHVLGLFPNADEALAVTQAVLDTLPGSTEPARGFGAQRLLDSRGSTTSLESRLLASASSFGLSDVVALVRRHKGLAVAAHVDRPSFSVIGQLGGIPADVRFDAIEVSVAGLRAGRVAEYAGPGLPVVCSSDAHSLAEVGSGFTVFEVGAVRFCELALALAGQLGRGIVRA